MNHLFLLVMAAAVVSFFGPQDFLLIYSLYLFDGKNWTKLERREKGYLDFAGDIFPDRKLFP